MSEEIKVMENIKPNVEAVSAVEIQKPLIDDEPIIKFVSSADFIKRCQCLIAEYWNEHKDKSKKPDGTDIIPDMWPEEVYVVWYNKSLQNHKGLFSTPSPDGMYYEMTYNGDKNELYMDAYHKTENKCFAGEF